MFEDWDKRLEIQPYWWFSLWQRLSNTDCSKMIRSAALILIPRRYTLISYLCIHLHEVCKQHRLRGVGEKQMCLRRQ